MKYVQKDITTVTAPGLIAHGVNCQDAMGSGVARALYMKWHEVKNEYHRFGSMVLGDAQFVEVEPGLVVANCFTQEYYGRDGRQYASLSAIRDSLTDTVLHAQGMRLREVHLPKIGCGLGGLDWEKDLEPLLIALEAQLDITFVVCEQ
jgi:O-acetyl-ADP-ribose deacetylase (regulator of RNase III)